MRLVLTLLILTKEICSNPRLRPSERGRREAIDESVLEYISFNKAIAFGVRTQHPDVTDLKPCKKKCNNPGTPSLTPPILLTPPLSLYWIFLFNFVEF